MRPWFRITLILTLVAVLWSFPAFAFFLSHDLSIDADHVDAYEREILLSDHVVISHPLGHLTADQGQLYRCDAKKPYKKGEVFGNVVINLANGDTLTCHRALVDLDQKKIFCLASSEVPVCYTLRGEEEDPQSQELETQGEGTHQLTAHKITLTLSPDSTPLPPPSSSLFTFAAYLRQVEATGSVVITTAQGEQIAADAVTYHPLPSLLPSPLKERYASTLPQMPASELRNWKDAFHLQGNIEVTSKLGKLSCDREMWVTRSDAHSTLEGIDCILCLGCTNIQTSLAQRLTTLDPFLIDRQAQTASTLRTDSIADAVFLSDPKGEIWADHLLVTFTTEDHLKLQHITFTGNARLKQALPLEDDPLALQYALADQIEYSPASEKMVLSSQTHPVLFLDPTCDTRVSAKKIIYHRAKQEVKGIGKVRLNFTEQEVEQLRQQLMEQHDPPS